MFSPGPWKKSKVGGAIVVDHAVGVPQCSEEGKEVYGGNLLAESMTEGNMALALVATDMYDILVEIQTAGTLHWTQHERIASLVRRASGHAV